MPGPLRLRAPTSLEYFATLVADEASLPLLEAAAAIGQHANPALDPQSVLAAVDELAARLKCRLPPDAAPLQRLRLLNRYFFHELGFAGNVNDYYDARNSDLSEVLKTRRGIPITLALLYIELAAHAGLQARGVSFPGHFLVKLHMPLGEVVIDPFSGRSLSRDELEERLAPFRRRRGSASEDDPPLGLYLQAASPREMLVRLLRNLEDIHRSAEDWPRLREVLDRLVVLLPDAWCLRRERGLVQAALGSFEPAVADLEVYLRHCPDAADAAALRARIAELRRPPRGLVH